MTTLTRTDNEFSSFDVKLSSHTIVPSHADYQDAFITLSPSSRILKVRHPGIPLLTSEHTLPFHQIHFLKCAADLDLLPHEYRVWGPGPSWIWWAWDLRRAGFLQKTERERCFVAKVNVGWIHFWIGFTVVDAELFRQTLAACEFSMRGMT
jgi:hypothetical protein